MKALVLFSTPLLAVMAMLFAVVVVLAPSDPNLSLSLAASGCISTQDDSASDIRLGHEQVAVAKTIVSVGKSVGAPPRGWVIAIAAGLQESGLRPLNFGDRDSLGVFQQRSGWGSRDERLNPRTAARMFFLGGRHGQKGLLEIDDWKSLPLTTAAQAVQRSAYPDAYAKWEGLAVQTVRRLSHRDGSCLAHGSWVLPTGRIPYVLTAGFGECGGLWSHCHTGQDFAVPAGTPISAASTGTVVFAGRSGPYGLLVRVLHSDGIATWYGHLSEIRTTVGNRVSPGDLIGLSGSTGNTTGPHLHLEVRTNATASSEGTPIDPLPWLHSHNVL